MIYECLCGNNAIAGYYCILAAGHKGNHTDGGRVTWQQRVDSISFGEAFFPFSVEELVPVAALDRAYRFLCGLQLNDHSIAEQKEYLDVVRELGRVLRPGKDGDK